MSDDVKTTNEEKSPTSSKLDSASNEELIKLLKTQLLSKKKLESRISELTTSNVSLCQTEEQLQNQLDDEQIKSRSLTIELDQYKINERKLQQELNTNRESVECLQLQNDTLKSSCKNLNDEISDVRLSFTNIEEDLRNKLNESNNTIENLLNEKQLFEEERIHLKQSIENLEVIKEKFKVELDDLRSKSEDKQEINNYQKQTEDFEFNQIQQQSSIYQSNENLEQEEYISKVLTDIPEILQSIGITNYIKKDFSSPLNLESTLRLCSLLIERCKVLQNDVVSMNAVANNELVSVSQNEGYEQCRVVIHGQDHSGLNTLFQRLDTSIDSNDWQISLAKPIDQNADQYIRLELNDFKFVSEKVEHDLIEVRNQLNQLSKENEEQRHEISTLEEYLRSSEQLIKQHEETNESQKLLTIEKTKFDELEISYQELQRRNEHLQSELELLKENFQTKDIQQQETIDKLQFDYEREHLYLLERDENIRLLNLNIEQQKEKLDNINAHQDEHNSLLKQQKQLSDLLETQMNEGKSVTERNLQLENDLKENNQLFFDKTKQADDLDKQLQIINKEYEDIQMKFNNQKSDYDQIIETLKQDLENNKLNLEQNKEEIDEDKSRIENELQHTIENLQQELELKKNDLKDLQLKYTEEKQLINVTEEQQDSLSNNLQSEVEKLQQENEQLHQTLNEERKQFQTILDQEPIEKTKFDELEISYQELQRRNEHLQSELELLKENFQTKDIQQQETIDKLQFDYEREHLYLLERDENIRLLNLNIEQQKEKLDNINAHQDEHNSLLKQQKQLSDLLETQMNEGKSLTERNLQLENDLKENNQLFFDKTKQADDLDKQLQIINKEYEDIQMKFNNQKSDYNQIVETLKQDLEKNKEEIDEDKSRIENELQHTIENLKQELELTKNDLNDLQIKYTEEKQLVNNIEQQQTSILNNLQSEVEKLQQENEQLHQTLNEERKKFHTILDQETIEKTKFDELEISYQELQRRNEHLQSELELLKENFQTKDIQQQETIDKLQFDYEREHLYLLERDENIRLLNLNIEQQKEKLDNINAHQDEHNSLLKQQKQLSDLLETQMNEGKSVTERNLQLENDLKENNQLFFDKTKQADDLDKQLQIINKEYEDIQMKFNNQKSNYDQIIENLKLDLAKTKEAIQQDKIRIEDELQHTINNLKQELEVNKTVVKDLQLKQTKEKQLVNSTEQQQTSRINNLQLDFEKLQQENEQLHQTLNELNHKLENQTTVSDATIQDLKEKEQKMKILLARLKKQLNEKNQQPKQSLMDLELADYEKTIKTLKDDLLHKDKEIQDLRDELTNSTDKNLSIKQEIENLEQQKLQTDERANKLQILLDTTKKELQNAKDLEQERHQNEDNIRVLIDRLQIQTDDQKVSISQLLSEKQQLTERINNQSETTQRTITLLEQNLRIVKHDLDVGKQDYDTLQDDFNNYKIRAQSVLKQHQSTQREAPPTMPDKQNDYEETIEKLKATLREASNKIQLLKSENEALQKEQDRLNETQSKILNESRKRDQELRKQHQIELYKTENDCLKRTTDTHDMMKNMTLQNETLSTTFKEQIGLIEADHARSVSILQNQLQASKQEIEQLKNRIELLRQTSVDNERDSSQIAIVNDINKDDLPWAYPERQQGEGSESVSTDHQSTDVAVKTLENVLFGNATNTQSSSSNLEKPRHILFEDIELERQRTEEELTKTKFRLLNTNELLNESELNNVRLSEQVSLLKDEIRRIERNMDRAESISNLEYLKNVILKFFILKSTPERLQLIPVLVTMLKLSPDEQTKLVHVAQQTSSMDDYSATNQSNTQQVTNNADSNSWSSYLNIW